MTAANAPQSTSAHLHEQQAKGGFSLQAQEKARGAHADSQHWDLVGAYSDEGYAAKDIKRPELTWLPRRRAKDRARWEKTGRIEVETATGFHRYDLAKLRGLAPHRAPSTRATLLYARVFSHEQQDDLARQAAPAGSVHRRQRLDVRGVAGSWLGTE